MTTDPKVIAEAQAHLARLRWKGTTKRERSDAMREVARKGWASGKRRRKVKPPSPPVTAGAARARDGRSVKP